MWQLGLGDGWVAPGFRLAEERCSRAEKAKIWIVGEKLVCSVQIDARAGVSEAGWGRGKGKEKVFQRLLLFLDM